MSGTKAASLAGVKRKREAGKEGRSKSRTKSRRQSHSEEAEDPQATILQLEAQIVESRRHYNNIASLLQLVKQHDTQNETAVLAAVALCRVFSRLIAARDMVKSKGMPESEVVIVQWLKERYREYQDFLLEQYLRSENAPTQSVGLTLVMRLVKEESKGQKEYNWKHGPLSKLVEILLHLPEQGGVLEEYAEKYFKPFDDIRFYTFQAVTYVLRHWEWTMANASSNTLESDITDTSRQLVSSNSLSLLMSLDQVPTSKDDIQNFFTDLSSKSKNPIPSMSAYKGRAQDAWLSAFRGGISKDQRKAILGVFAHQIAPWFQQPEMLMDFLTDSYDLGGGTSLLALSGLYYLISEKNLDYPAFYTKLYSLLDDGLLHSKHRSRFFRLLDTFMSSTHLPAAMVASFIKRLSRLALNAPPAGIVAVLPWIYNMFKRHPACTFMIHRETRDAKQKKKFEEEGMEDPFDMTEQDPMFTNAIESSLWEIETLQSHYHPNVATLAEIISEQFTKLSYNLEDFLDHSYNAVRTCTCLIYQNTTVLTFP
jgi:U3 small nucleolar RNA-associated protein 19